MVSLKVFPGWMSWYTSIIPATQEEERGKSLFKASLGKILVRSTSTNKPGMMVQF
jgi:hypothetical protein